MKTLKSIVSQTKELERIDSYRLGTIVKVDLEKNGIWIDYKDNPLKKPVLAKLGTPWVGSEELTFFINRADEVKLEFLNGDPTHPIIKDLFFSVNQMNSSQTKPANTKVMKIEADEIVLNGHQRIVIQSGNARTIYRAEGSQIIQEAEQIESTAVSENRLKGGAVLLN
jgi:hypothetical protein